MIVGIGVEGPSDRSFWDKVLHKHFPRVRFDIRNMKNRANLIREASRLLESFRDSGYKAGLILLDRDKDPCVTAVISRFDRPIQTEVRQSLATRYLFACIAIKELEAWFLADATAIKGVLPNVAYSPPIDTGTVNAEVQLKSLWNRQFAGAAFNKIDFAKRIAPKFSPNRATLKSTSFTYFWQHISTIASS